MSKISLLAVFPGHESWQRPAKTGWMHSAKPHVNLGKISGQITKRWLRVYRTQGRLAEGECDYFEGTLGCCQWEREHRSLDPSLSNPRCVRLAGCLHWGYPFDPRLRFPENATRSPVLTNFWGSKGRDESHSNIPEEGRGRLGRSSQPLPLATPPVSEHKWHGSIWCMPWLL